MRITFEFYRTIFFLGIIINLLGCASVEVIDASEKSYTIGAQKVVKEGDLILSESQGEMTKRKNWVGVINSSDGWGPIQRSYAEGFLRKELRYLGITGQEIHIMYLEYRERSKIPAVEESISVDLNSTNTINFKGYKLQVIEVNNTDVTFIVLTSE